MKPSHVFDSRVVEFSLDRTYEELKHTKGIRYEVYPETSLDRTYEELKLIEARALADIIAVWIVPMRN